MRELVEAIEYERGVMIKEVGSYLPEPSRNVEQRLQLLCSHHLYTLGETKSNIWESFMRRQRRLRFDDALEDKLEDFRWDIGQGGHDDCRGMEAARL